MNDAGHSLLTTKLHVPRPSVHLVPRPRLMQQLTAGMDAALTLISAPPGFGKTSLIAEWHAGPGRAIPLAWLSLDEDDNDPARFLAYLLAAARTVAPGAGQGLAGVLQASPVPPVEDLLPELVNELSAAAPGPDQRLALVLDDYHVIESHAIHHAVSFLLDHRPPALRLIVATRTDPPLPLARLRSRAQLVELRAPDLCFTAGETEQFLNQAMGLALAAGDVAALAARTEGWIAGLQLAAASLRGRDAARVAEFIRGFTGSHRYVLDYLAEEVLARQTGEVQAFLLATSVLERMTAALCDAVTGRGDGRAALEYLERANLFVVPLDDERRWYRYHALFADLLRKRLEQDRPGHAHELHRRASAWYAAQGLWPDAIRHALAGRDVRGAAELIEQAAEAALGRSEIVLLQGWLEALPEDVLRAHSLLSMYHAAVSLLSGQPLAAVEAHLRDAGGDGSATGAPAEVAVLRALMANFQGDEQDSLAWSRRALELLPEERLFLRSVVTGNLAMAYLMNGDVPLSLRALEEAESVARRAGNTLMRVIAISHQAEMRMLNGKLREAEAVYRRALAAARDAAGDLLPIAGMALIGLGELARQWNDLEAAARQLRDGLTLTSRWGEMGMLEGYIALARTLQAQGDAEGAAAVLDTARQSAEGSDTSSVDDLFVQLYAVRLAAAQGDRAEARRWLESYRPVPSAAYYHMRELEGLTRTRVLLALGRGAAALEALAALQPEVESRGRGGSLIELLALRALALDAGGDGTRARQALGRALSMAEPEGYVRLFADEGPPMAALLARIEAADVDAPRVRETLAYRDRLLAAFGPRDARSAAPAAQRATLPEPLGERELEVLRLLDAGLSNREIAERLVVALSTVKWYVNSLFAKLDVHSRTQALARARELGLL